jgi:hypothetical protein
MRRLRPPHSSWKLRHKRKRNLSRTNNKGLRQKLVCCTMPILTARADLVIQEIARQPLTTLVA